MSLLPVFARQSRSAAKGAEPPPAGTYQPAGHGTPAVPGVKPVLRSVRLLVCSRRKALDP